MYGGLNIIQVVVLIIAIFETIAIYCKNNMAQTMQTTNQLVALSPSSGYTCHTFEYLSRTVCCMYTDVPELKPGSQYDIRRCKA